MNADKLLSSLCYFSVFFAPFLFPIIIFIVANGNVRQHAGKALWTHLVPYLCVFIGLGAGYLAWHVSNTTTAFTVIILFAIIAIYYLVLNLVRGIAVLIANETSNQY